MFRNVIFIALCAISTSAISASFTQGGSPEKLQPPAKVKPEWDGKIREGRKNYPDHCIVDGCPPVNDYPDRCPIEGCQFIKNYPDLCPLDEGCPPR